MGNISYGLPYKGSKRKLAADIVAMLPSAVRFYDVFAGGCAVTHAALLSDIYQQVICNDISDAPRLFVDAVHGKYRNESRWMSRDDFQRLRDSDPYVRICWSFGNNGKSYLYSRDIEPYKRAVHCAVVFDDWRELRRLCPEIATDAEEALRGMTGRKERRVSFGRAVVASLRRIGSDAVLNSNPLYRACHFKGGKKGSLTLSNVRLQSLESLQSLERLESLQSLQSLESLERLESLESLQRLERLQGDYRDIRIEPGSVIYCDPPYHGTDGYGVDFDHDAFCRWCMEQESLVVISEYNMPDGFTCVAEFEHRSTLCATANKAVKERLYVPSHQIGMFKKVSPQPEFDFGAG